MKRTLFESNGTYTIDEYIEYLKDCEEFDENKAYNENDTEFAAWVCRENEFYLNDLFLNLDYSFNNGNYLVEGTLDLWDGKKEILPVAMPSLKKAIEKCVLNDDIYKFEIFYEDGKFVINAHHHDGVNVFTLSKMTDIGVTEFNKAIEDCTFGSVKEEWIELLAENDGYLM